ncbi:MAG: hypothetical protein KGI08_10205 [Thaumarchaeota archaeon]|nr:hypothetical protein [Nitrososphaerota archaeon]
MKYIPVTHQASIDAARKPLPRLAPFMAVVVNAYSDRMTCDIAPPPNVPNTGSNTTPLEAVFFNVPVVVNGGIDPQSNEIWGEMETPQVNDYVIVDYLGPYYTMMAIVGTIYPFTMSYFQSNQTPVNSTNKQFSKKLLVSNQLKTYRRIFKSGTTIEIGEDGTVTIETPSGSYIQMSESGDNITIEPKNKVSIKNASQNLYTLLNNLQSALNNFSDAAAQSAITAGGSSSASLAAALNVLLTALNTSIVSFGTGLGGLMQ